MQVADKAMQWQPYRYSPEEVKRNDPNKKRRWLIPLVLAAQIALKVSLWQKCCGKRLLPSAGCMLLSIAAGCPVVPASVLLSRCAHCKSLPGLHGHEAFTRAWASLEMAEEHLARDTLAALLALWGAQKYG